MRSSTVIVLGLVGCAAPRRPSLTLTYLGVAGWQIDSGATTILADPYFSRPDLTKPIVPDAAAIAAHAPARADRDRHRPLARRSPARRAGRRAAHRRAADRQREHDTRRAGERRAGRSRDHRQRRRGLRVRSVLDPRDSEPALRARSQAHVRRAIGEVSLPMTFAQYEEGGTFAYLIRVGGHEIDRVRHGELHRARARRDPSRHRDHRARATRRDPRLHVPLVARARRSEIGSTRRTSTNGAARRSTRHRMKTCRRSPPRSARCSPSSRLVIPKHFAPMTVP